MDLFNRLKKLEEKSAASGANLPYCVCNGPEPRYEVYQQVGDGVPMRDGKPMTNTSELCTQCRKPIVVSRMIIQIVGASGNPAPDVFGSDVATFRINTREERSYEH